MNGARVLLLGSLLILFSGCVQPAAPTADGSHSHVARFELTKYGQCPQEAKCTWNTLDGWAMLYLSDIDWSARAGELEAVRVHWRESQPLFIIVQHSQLVNFPSGWIQTCDTLCETTFERVLFFGPKQPGLTGLSLQGMNHTVFLDSQVTGYQNCIRINDQSGQGVWIEGLSLTECKLGMRVDNPSTTVVQKMYAQTSTAGLIFFGGRLVVEASTFEDGQTGIESHTTGATQVSNSRFTGQQLWSLFAQADEFEVKSSRFEKAENAVQAYMTGAHVPLISDSSFVNIHGFALDANGVHDGYLAQAQDNYWDSELGPTVEPNKEFVETPKMGRGARVTPNVDFVPFNMVPSWAGTTGTVAWGGV